MNQALLSSKEMDWCTPQDFFDELNALYHFVLDVAATHETAKCADYYTPETDGLVQSWYRADGAVFCNPPYGRNICQWVKKAYDEAKSHHTTIVLLIPARTDTAYFHRYIYNQPNVVIYFLRGRLKFERPDGTRMSTAPFPSMIVIFNPPK